MKDIIADFTQQKSFSLYQSSFSSLYFLLFCFAVYFQVEASLRVANFSKHFQLLAKEFDRTSFSVDTNRKLEALLYIGDAALDDQEKLEEVH